jgi:hypothetical protein
MQATQVLLFDITLPLLKNLTWKLFKMTTDYFITNNLDNHILLLHSHILAHIIPLRRLSSCWHSQNRNSDTFQPLMSVLSRDDYHTNSQDSKFQNADTMISPHSDKLFLPVPSGSTYLAESCDFHITYWLHFFKVHVKLIHILHIFNGLIITAMNIKIWSIKFNTTKFLQAYPLIQIMTKL